MSAAVTYDSVTSTTSEDVSTTTTEGGSSSATEPDDISTTTTEITTGTTTTTVTITATMTNHTSSTSTRPSTTTTTYIPMDTSWTMPSGCSSLFQYNMYPFDIALIAFDPSYGENIDPSYKCLPPAATQWFLSGTYYESDAEVATSTEIMPITCPDGWHTAKTSTYEGSTLAVTCCPSGYIEDYPGQAEGAECYSDLTPGATVTYASYGTLSNGAPDTESWTSATTNLITHSGIGAVAIKGYAVASATSTPTPANGTEAEGAEAVEGSGGLSTGAKAGIGVGVGVGGLLVLGLAAWLLWRKRARAASPAEMSGETAEVAELPENKDSAQEMDSNAIKPELAADRPIAELEGSEMVHERSAT
ncbi:hypothetical protein BDV18DRAFT_70075 [Aspergillus unguis]